MSHYRHRADANCKAIAAHFERLGYLVHRTNDSWDLTVCKPFQLETLRLIEVKDPDSPNLKRKNKGNELIDQGFPIIRVMSLEDVLALT